MDLRFRLGVEVIGTFCFQLKDTLQLHGAESIRREGVLLHFQEEKDQERRKKKKGNTIGFRL